MQAATEEEQYQTILSAKKRVNIATTYLKAKNYLSLWLKLLADSLVMGLGNQAKTS
jgi:hypothetical protein